MGIEINPHDVPVETMFVTAHWNNRSQMNALFNNFWASLFELFDTFEHFLNTQECMQRSWKGVTRNVFIGQFVDWTTDSNDSNLQYNPRNVSKVLFVCVLWNYRIVMMPTLLSVAAPEVVLTTTSGAVSDDKVGIMTI